jgi:hypothetical protein
VYSHQIEVGSGAHDSGWDGETTTLVVGDGDTRRDAQDAQFVDVVGGANGAIVYRRRVDVRRRLVQLVPSSVSSTQRSTAMAFEV